MDGVNQGRGTVIAEFPDVSYGSAAYRRIIIEHKPVAGKALIRIIHIKRKDTAMNWGLLAIIAVACWLLGFSVICLLRKTIWTPFLDLSFDVSSIAMALVFSFLGSVAGVFAGLATYLLGVIMFADGGFKEDPTILAYVFVAACVLICSAPLALIALLGKQSHYMCPNCKRVSSVKWGIFGDSAEVCAQDHRPPRWQARTVCCGTAVGNIHTGYSTPDNSQVIFGKTSP